MIDLYSANTPNGKKISIMLEEIGYEYKVIKIDIDKGEQFKIEFKKQPPENISFPRSANNVNQFKDKHTVYKKGTPIHIRGSILYNKLLNDREKIFNV